MVVRLVPSGSGTFAFNFECSRGARGVADSTLAGMQVILMMLEPQLDKIQLSSQPEDDNGGSLSFKTLRLLS